MKILFLIGIFLFSLSSKAFTNEKPNIFRSPKALKSFKELSRLNKIEQITYVKAMYKVAKSKTFKTFTQASFNKIQGHKVCFLNLFSIGNKCNITSFKVTDFFSDPLNEQRWERFRLSVNLSCSSKKQCEGIKSLIENQYQKDED